LLILAEGVAVFACILRQLPAAVAEERVKLLADFAHSLAQHETSAAGATLDLSRAFPLSSQARGRVSVTCRRLTLPSERSSV
jgi:hypothetical protein